MLMSKVKTFLVATTAIAGSAVTFAADVNRPTGIAELLDPAAVAPASLRRRLATPYRGVQAGSQAGGRRIR